MKNRKKKKFWQNFLGRPLFQGSVGKLETRLFFLALDTLIKRRKYQNWCQYSFTAVSKTHSDLFPLKGGPPEL